MSFGDTLILVLGGLAICAVCATLMVWATEKAADALGWRERSDLDATRREDLRDLIERAESKGIDIPESLRSAAT